MKIVLALLLLIPCSLGFSSDSYVDQGGSHLWNDPLSWYSGAVPNYFTGVIGGFSDGQTCNIVSGDNAVASYLYWGWSTPNPATTTFNVSGTGSLTVAGDFFNATSDSNNTSYLNLSGNAVVKVGGSFEVTQWGRLGVLNIRDNASLIADQVWVTLWNPGVTGSIQLDGGVLQALSVFQMRSGTTATVASVDCNGGVLKVPMSYRGAIEGYIREGSITARGKVGLDKFKIDTDGSSYYSFQAIPDANYARDPVPANGSNRIPASTILSWTAGSHAAAHNFFFGTDLQTVTNAVVVYSQGDLNKDGSVNIADIAVLAANWLGSELNGYDLKDFALLAKQWLNEFIFKGELIHASYAVNGLDSGKTYYWRVDEVNETCPQSPWKGNVWNFSTPDGIAESAYYISTTGSNNNPGTLAQPFATLEKAREVLQQKSLPAGGVTIYLRGGNYYRTSSFDLTAKDSGEPDKQIVYKAYPGEAVRIIGGISIDPGWFTLATSTSPTSSIYNRIDAAAKGNVYWINLTARGITNYGVLSDRGYNAGDKAVSPLELVYNGQVMTIARWPNADAADWARTVAGVTTTSFKYSGTRPSRWKITDNLWMHGFWDFGWIDRHLNITAINTAASTITWGTDYGTVPQSNMPWYLYNSLEELDQAGEYYLAPTSTSRLFFWPPSPLAQSEILFSMLNDPLVKTDGASYITFSDITFECCRGKAIVIGGGTENHIIGCTIKNVGSTGICLSGTSSSVENSQIHDVGNSAVVVSGGDRYALVSCNNIVKNCRIFKYGRWAQTYQNAGIFINYACGVKVSNNAIYNGPCQAIMFYGNNNLIELNEFYNVCQHVGDAGVIYDGQGWAHRGNIVRNNLFRNNSSSLFGNGAIQAIYFDDVTSGNLVEGNIFYQTAGQATFNGGGNYNTYQNNIYIKNYIAHHGDRRGATWVSDSLMQNYKAEVIGYNYTQPPWSTNYPELIPLLDLPWAQAKEPVGIKLDRNFGWQNTYWTEGDGLAYTTGSNIINQDPLFYDEPNMILAVRDDSPVYGISGFIRVPWERMGVLLETQASRPLPSNTCSLPITSGLNLYWAPALKACSHKLYFGTDPNPRTAGYKGTFTNPSWVTGTLQAGTTYYWCVDEIDSNGNTLDQGPIWMFRTH